jgi:outer membrane lipopolysaccharide assembly protein LptE/RlpB
VHPISSVRGCVSARCRGAARFHRLCRTLAIVALLPLTGCGYALAGRGSSLPEYIRTIGVPLFTNATSIFDVEQALTQRVRLEFLGRGRYKVVSDEANTDAVLKGEITSISIRPTAFNDQQQASRYEITVVVKVEFTDVKTAKVLYDNPAQTFREEYDVTNVVSADVASFLGQNVNAFERLANDFAKTVVSSILEAF